LHAKRLMTTEELEDDTQEENIMKFYSGSIKILERWMKIMCLEEGDIASTLVVDQLIKGMIIKLDSVFEIKNKLVDEERESFKSRIKEMKTVCKDKLEL